MAENALGDDQRRARASEQRRRRAAQIMKAQRPRQSLGPEAHAALWAAPLRDRLVMFAVTATLAPADEVVAPHDACTTKRTAEYLLQVRLFGPHRTVRSGEDVLALRRSERGLQVRHEGLGDGDHVGVSALRGLIVVRAPDRDRASGDINVRLEQPEKLAFAHPRPNRRSKERRPPRSEAGEQRPHPLCPDRLQELPGDSSPPPPPVPTPPLP